MQGQPTAPGPLQELEEGFLDELSGLGYSPRTSETQLNLMRHLSRWLLTRGMTAGDLTDEVAAEFMIVRRSCTHCSGQIGRSRHSWAISDDEGWCHPRG